MTLLQALVALAVFEILTLVGLFVAVCFPPDLSPTRPGPIPGSRASDFSRAPASVVVRHCCVASQPSLSPGPSAPFLSCQTVTTG